MKTSLQDTIQVCEDVIFRELEGEAVLLNLDTGIYFGLNEVGTRAWNLLQQQSSLRAVYEALQAAYEVTGEQLQADLLGLLDEMREKGLIRVSASARQ